MADIDVVMYAVNHIKEEMGEGESFVDTVNRLAKGDNVYLDVHGYYYSFSKAQLLEVVNSSLPICASGFRAIPNGILRSALFGAIRKGRRNSLYREQIATIGNVTIEYTGIRLDQNDLSVWESVLYAVQNQSLGNQCRISLYSILKIMGKTNSGGSGNRNSLHSSIIRLASNTVEIRQDKYVYGGSLIQEYFKDDSSSEYIIVINPKLKNLYQPNAFTYIDWNIRRFLEGKQLSQWLHGFYSTHAEPYPIKIETLHKLSGSSSNELWKFKQNLIKALDHLKKAYESEGKEFDYKIKDNLVFVNKTATKSQKQHIKLKLENITP